MIIGLTSHYEFRVRDPYVVRIEVYRYSYIHSFTDESPINWGYRNDPPAYFYGLAIILLTWVCV